MPDEMRAEDAPFPMTTRHQTISERGQLALFWALPGDFAPRDAQDLMAYPFFSLSKSHRVTPIDFAAGNISIRVEAVADHGMATIWDADILIWAASQIVEARDAGLRTSRLMAATPYEILTFVRSWHLAARLSAPLRLSRSGDHEDACRLRGATRLQTSPPPDTHLAAGAAEKSLALKGGTAINLFVRDLPRLSVDIDLVNLPMDDRDMALKNIAEALSRIAETIIAAMPGTEIIRSFEHQADALRLFVSQGDDRIKIEFLPVLRGSVFPEELREVAPAVEEQFGYVEMQLLSIPDLYAGKICAALDRQHPRDLFDVNCFSKSRVSGKIWSGPFWSTS